MSAESYLVAVLLPCAVMVIVGFLVVGATTLGKAAMSTGISPSVLVSYSNALATLFVFPCFIFYRKNRGPISFSLLCRFFLVVFIGITVMQNCLVTGVNYSSPTLSSAMSQLIPVFTFLLAVILKMEKLDLRSSRSQIRILCTLVSISGAMVVIFYKGFPMGPASVPTPTGDIVVAANSWIIGGTFLTVSALSSAISGVFEVVILKEYPSEMTLVFFFCLFGTIQCAIVALIVERKSLDAWKLSSSIELITITSAAVVLPAVTWGTAWCISKRGPVFAAMFKPLDICIAAILGVIFLGDTLHVGTIVGGIVIVVGFYGVIWAQSMQEEGKGDSDGSGQHSSMDCSSPPSLGEPNPKVCHKSRNECSVSPIHAKDHSLFKRSTQLCHSIQNCQALQNLLFLFHVCY